MDCKIYRNTNFNAVNIPDSPALITNNFMPLTVNALDIMQDKFLQSVRVAASWSDVEGADYCLIGGFWYIVSGVRMLATDTAELSLVPDFITSIGGPGALTILDGITVRHHVSTDEDTFGAYADDDPYIVCNSPLQVVSGGWTGGSTTAQHIFIESTVALPRVASSKNAVTWVDPDDSTKEVSIPYAPPIAGVSYFAMGGESGAKVTNGTRLYLASPEYPDSDVMRGMQLVRSMGVESGIISQYSVPDDFYTVGDDSAVSDEYTTVGTITGASGSYDTGLPFIYSSVRNQRALYGKQNSYGIITASGEKFLCNPEQIYTTGLTSPQVNRRVDVRPSGCPYFGFANYAGASNFWQSAIKGTTWRDVPLVYNSRSGSMYKAAEWRSKMNIEAVGYYGSETGRLVEDVAEPLETIASMVKGIATGGNAAEAAGTGLISLGNNMLTTVSNDTYREIYDLTRKQELFHEGVERFSQAPEVFLPASSDAVRDYVGNGFLCFRYRPSDTDLAHIDKVLTMYGYKDTQPLTLEMFTNRPSFNYVQVSGITVGGNIPRWWKSGIADQLQAGTRIWHVIPSPSYYTANA